MVMRVSRRALLAGAAAGFATSAFGNAPLTSMRPRARVPVADAVRRFVADADLSGRTGVVVADLRSGEILENIAGTAAQPPASVTKAVTALYAVETLGADHRFETRVLTDGRVVDGVVEGNLILAGGGDPDLMTDDLATLAANLKATGLREVRGDFLVWDEALRNVEEIDPQQLDHFGYNPTITGLNLNYNRVHFEWKREEGEYTTAIDARSANYRPAVTVTEVALVDRDMPVFAYRDAGDVDRWTIARSALNAEGSRWLPVRHPALYAGEVFATFMRSHGVILSRPRETLVMPGGLILARYRSAPLDDQLRFMLRNSINLSAEVTGMTATARLSGQRPGMRVSAEAMSAWVQKRCGGVTPAFVDHSGLGDASRISAAEMVTILSAPQVRDRLFPILRERRIFDDAGTQIARPGMHVRAKTGTLNFVSSLAGYVRSESGRDLAFAIFSADMDRREAGKRSGQERPAGSRAWGRKARNLQQQIVRHLALRVPS